jgi:hypothetical protein
VVDKSFKHQIIADSIARFYPQSWMDVDN